MSSLPNLALLQLLCLLKSERSRFERVRKMVYRNATSRYALAPGALVIVPNSSNRLLILCSEEELVPSLADIIYDGSLRDRPKVRSA
jgi:hypothetical protein